MQRARCLVKALVFLALCHNSLTFVISKRTKIQQQPRQLSNIGCRDPPISLMVLQSGRGEELHTAIKYRKERTKRTTTRQINTSRLAASSDKGDKDTSITSEQADEDLTGSYIILGVLLATFAANQWSRQAIYYLCDFSPSADAFRHINKDLAFSQEMYGTLASLGFTVVFALVSLFAGSVADQFNRTNIVFISCAVWSIATALNAKAVSYEQLVPMRALVGASQAFFNPAAYTLLADKFPQRLLGSVNGIFSSGIYLGGALASLSILLDNFTGWRNTMLVIGGAGLLIAFLGLAYIEDPRFEYRTSNVEAPAATAVATKTTTSPGQVRDSNKSMFELLFTAFNNAVIALQEVTDPVEAKLLFSAAALRFCAGFSLVIWKAPFVFDKFPGNEAAFAGSNAVIVATGGLLSSLLGGYISDRLASPKQPSSSNSSGQINDSSAGIKPISRSWVPAVGSLLAAPFWAGFILSPTPALAAGCLFFEYLTAECWFGPVLASLFAVVPPQRRGAAQGFFSLLTAAGNLGPVLVGSLVQAQVAPLGTVLLVVVSGAYLLSGLLFAVVARREDAQIQDSMRSV